MPAAPLFGGKLLLHGSKRIALRGFHETEEGARLGFIAQRLREPQYFRRRAPAVHMLGFWGIRAEKQLDDLKRRITCYLTHFDVSASDVVLSCPEEKQSDLDRHHIVVHTVKPWFLAKPAYSLLQRCLIRRGRFAGIRVFCLDRQREK